MPKKQRAINGEVLTPAMELIVTTKNFTNDPFNNGATDVIEAYKRTYNFDYRKCGCTPMDFDWVALDQY